MNTIEKLKTFKKEFDLELEKYFDFIIKKTEKTDETITKAIKHVRKITLSGGKRLRPALMYYGYMASGKRDFKRVLKTSVSIELIHAFLLIHDDIMDRGLTRHGVDTINFKYEKIGKRFFPKKNSEHFGNSIAIIVGDMICALGNQIIFESGFDPKIIMEALSKLQDIVSYTVIGQTQDIYIEYKNRATEKEVMKMYEYKTAKYTIDGPLQLGAILGGADEKIKNSFSRYAIPIGIAFQIQDDILGVFSADEKLGKSASSDIEGGKQTLLVIKARENANNKQKRMLDDILGKNNLTKKEIENFKNVIVETGSLEYAKKMSYRLINEGKRELEKIKMEKEAKDFLLGIADYMIEREL